MSACVGACRGRLVLGPPSRLPAQPRRRPRSRQTPAAYLRGSRPRGFPADAAAVWSSRSTAARCAGPRTRPADESGQHDEARDHLRGAAPARPGVHLPHRGAGRRAAGRRRAARRAVRARRRRSAAGHRGPVAAGQPRCAASASATSAATWCSTRRCSSRCATTRRQFDGEEGRAYNVGPDALLVNFKSIAVTFVPDTAARWRASSSCPRSPA